MISGALRLLAERPDASMREIADASGLTRTTVYRHFASRDDLLRAIVGRIRDESDAMVAEATSVEGGAPAVLRSLARGIVGIADRYRFLDAQRLVRDEMVSPGEHERPLRDWIAGAAARGELRAEVDPDWHFLVLSKLAIGVCDEVVAGRLDTEEAARRLGDTFVWTLAGRA